ncbi:MAG: hypothetical protein HY698_16155 [Deltaproteobacteria bacterium]|nr:hypothetical protein [Deltaproteobacteria bacterium]
MRKRIHLAGLLAAWAYLLAACAPSAVTIKRARKVGYQVDFATVWNAVSAAVHERYARILVEDPARGRIRTDWHVVGESSAEVINAQGDMRPGAKVFRLFVEIEGEKGKAPWSISVDGEAAEYRPGMTLLSPYKHGDVDEPSWVTPRIDAIYLRVYKELERHAVGMPEREEITLERSISRWSHLPRDAARALAAVHEAASRGDPAALRPYMSSPFRSDAGELRADEVVPMWGADPSLLVPLVHALEGTCSQEGSDGVVRCTGGLASGKSGGTLALFRLVGGKWLLVAHVAL